MQKSAFQGLSGDEAHVLSSFALLIFLTRSRLILLRSTQQDSVAGVMSAAVDSLRTDPGELGLLAAMKLGQLRSDGCEAKLGSRPAGAPRGCMHRPHLHLLCCIWAAWALGLQHFSIRR